MERVLPGPIPNTYRVSRALREEATTLLPGSTDLEEIRHAPSSIPSANPLTGEAEHAVGGSRAPVKSVYAASFPPLC